MSNTLEMDAGVIQNMNFVEVRRLGEPKPNVNRKIMAKFRRVADREKVRKLRDKLKDKRRSMTAVTYLTLLTARIGGCRV